MRSLLPVAPAALALSLLIAAAPSSDALLARLLANRTAGPPISCIARLRPTENSWTINRVGIVYEVGGTRYLTRFKGGCDQLNNDTLLVTRTPTNQLCEGDIAFVAYRSPAGTPAGSCIYGPFVPYRR